MRRKWKSLLTTGALICTTVYHLPSVAAPQQSKTMGSTAGSTSSMGTQQSGAAIRSSAANPAQRFSERGLARRNLWFPVYSRNHTPVNPTRTKSITIETQISAGTPMNFPPGWRDDLLQEEQSVQNLQLSNNGAGAAAAGRVAIAPQGSMLISRQTPVTIHSGRHDVFVGAGAIAYVIHTGSELAVYNLASSHSGDITVKAPEGKQVYDVRKGHALILTEANDFSDSTLGKFISCTRPNLMAKEGDVNVFAASYSYLNMLDKCPQFQHGLASNDRNQRKLTNRLLKLSAARILSESSP